MGIRASIGACFFCTAAMCPAQYITLQGDQFIDEHGEPFFPMIMSYYVDYFYTDASVPDPYPTPAQVQALSYGRTSAIGHDGLYGYSSTDGPASILQDLAELKAQGFNTLRFVSNAKPMETGGMGLLVKRHPTGQGQILLPLEPPYLPDIDLNPTLWFHYHRILDVCSLAQSMDMKVLLEPFMNDDMLKVMPGDAEAQDHVALLASLAAFIHEHQVTNLLAYEIYGEPTYEDWWEPPLHTKAQICEIARGWNRALKDFDPDHLTTIGGVHFDDVLREGWDPLLLEVDFASMHPYPDPKFHEWEVDPATFLERAYQRYLSLVTWYDQYITKPYVISETGFQCEDPFSHPSGDPHPWLIYPYAVYGDEQVQDDFVRAVLPVLRGSRCAGFGWWIMQNAHELGEPPLGPEPPPDNFGAYAGRYYGLLRAGDPQPAPGTTGYEHLRKIAAQTLVQWATDPPPDATYDAPAEVDMTHFYYNPYMHPVNLGVTWTDDNDHPYYGTITGQVEDQFGDPIAGAAVKASSYIGRQNVPPDQFVHIEYAHYTFTDEQGMFEIRAFDPLPDNPADGDQDEDELRDRSIGHLEIGAHGSSWTIRGWDHHEQVFTLFQPNATYDLRSFHHLNDLILDYWVIWANETENFKALNTITAHEMSVLGNSEMLARNSVAWKPGFHAMAGSEVHAYVQPVIIECEDIAAIDLKIAIVGDTPSAWQLQTVREVEREVDLLFHVARPEPKVQVFPNPGRTFQVVLTEGHDPNSGWTGLRVVDDQGRMVLESGFTGSRYDLDLTSKAPGCYTIVLQPTLGDPTAHPVIVH